MLKTYEEAAINCAIKRAKKHGMLQFGYMHLTDWAQRNNKHDIRYLEHEMEMLWDEYLNNK